MKDKRLKELVKSIKDEFGISLKEKFIDEVDDPVSILWAMVNTAMNWSHKDYDALEIGKKLQMDREKNYNIPFKAELEVSAGVWSLIYEGKV
jgi:hypothetical protein